MNLKMGKAVLRVRVGDLVGCLLIEESESARRCVTYFERIFIQCEGILGVGRPRPGVSFAGGPTSSGGAISPVVGVGCRGGVPRHPWS